jgi:hypothetical protein
LNAARGLVAAVLLTATVTANALAGPENRLLNAALAAGIIALALFLAYTPATLSHRMCLVIAAVSITGAVAMVILYKSRQTVCTATNASGQRVVIGTELTALGHDYKQRNPAEDNSMILEALGGRGPEAAWTAESIRQCRFVLALSGALWVPLFGVAAVAAASIAGVGRSGAVAKPLRQKPRVFISYNHDDSAAAFRIGEIVKRHDIEVILDRDDMLPGERISDFIRRSIRDCDVVVSIISTRSLLSAWVASETIGAISRNTWGEEVTLIACYLDDLWLQPEFRLRCTEQIDERLQRIEELFPQYAARRIDTADLNEEKTRLYDLRNNLGTILAALENSLCLDVRENLFNSSTERLVQSVRTLWSAKKNAARVG